MLRRFAFLVLLALIAGAVIAVALRRDDAEDASARPAVHLLSEWLGVPEDSLRFEGSEDVTWRNGCLGIEWPGRVCTQVIVNGKQLTFRSPNGQPQIVRVADERDYVWAPIWESETTITAVNGLTIEFEAGRGGFSRLARLVPGTTIVGTPRAGARVYAAEASAVGDTDVAPLVVLVVLP